MNEQLQNHMVSIITSISDAVKATATFAWEQASDIAVSYVLYGRIKSAIILLLGIAVGVVLLKVAHWSYKNPWKDSSSYYREPKRSDSNIMAIIFPALGGVAMISAAIISFDLLVWAAPKVWLIKELALILK